MLRTAHSMANPYQELKEELAPNVLAQLYGIVYAPELGGQSPSQLNGLLAMLPPGEPAGLLFKMHFLLRLPMDIRDQVVQKMETRWSRRWRRWRPGSWQITQTCTDM